MSSLPAGQAYTLRSRSKTKSARLKVPSVRADLIPHRNVRCDLAIHQPLEQPGRAIDGVACEPLGLKIEAAADPVHHGLGNGDLNHAIGSRALGVDDDPDFVVDEIVRIIGKEGVDARPGNPCRLGIGQRDFLGRLAAAAARSATIPVIIVFATAGGIECREILADCIGMLPRPSARQSAGRLELASSC